MCSGGSTQGWPWLVVALCASVAGWAAVVRADRLGDESMQGVRAANPDAIGAQRYATSDTCRSCHPGAYATWHVTYHRTMTQTASGASILAPFDGQPVGDDERYRAGRDESGYWAESPGMDGVVQRHRVVMVTGSHHMQVYWVRPDPADGRLVAFDYAFLIDEGQWTPNESTLLRPPQSDVTYTWNRVCIKCHAVAGVPGFDPATGAVRSGAAELGIACEACHGPARAHVDEHRSPIARYAARLSDAPQQAVVHPGRMTADAASQICAQCHSITVFEDDEGWVRGGHQAAPPDPVGAWGALVRHPLRADQPLADALLDDAPDYFANRFWYDGMVRVSGREYNGVVESPCAQSSDFGCLSCHAMHGTDADDQLKSPDEDAPCRQCHAVEAAVGSTHTHHEAGSSGSRCVNCHMPHTTYGLLKAIRSHQISSPSVVEDEAVGRPNACNLCHVDRGLAWAADTLTAWYGQPHYDPPHAAREESAAVRWLLAGDAGQRALAAWHLGWEPTRALAGEGWQTPVLAELLDDPYAAVRWVAYRALRKQPGLEALDLGSLETVDRAAIERIRAGSSFDRDWIQRLRRARDLRPIALAE